MAQGQAVLNIFHEEQDLTSHILNQKRTYVPSENAERTSKERKGEESIVKRAEKEQYSQDLSKEDCKNIMQNFQGPKVPSTSNKINMPNHQVKKHLRPYKKKWSKN